MPDALHVQAGACVVFREGALERRVAPLDVGQGVNSAPEPSLEADGGVCISEIYNHKINPFCLELFNQKQSIPKKQNRQQDATKRMKK